LIGELDRLLQLGWRKEIYFIVDDKTRVPALLEHIFTCDKSRV
jgi:hypothetical protein